MVPVTHGSTSVYIQGACTPTRYLLPHGSTSIQINGAYTAKRHVLTNNHFALYCRFSDNPTVTYAMSPGQAVQGLYDYSTKTGMKQWIEATKPLDDKP